MKDFLIKSSAEQQWKGKKCHNEVPHVHKNKEDNKNVDWQCIDAKTVEGTDISVMDAATIER